MSVFGVRSYQGPSAEPVAGWHELAACVGEDPDLFHPVGDVWRAGAENAAKEICARCPVVAACLAFGKESGDQWGIYGGMTAEERTSRRPMRTPLGGKPEVLVCHAGHPRNAANTGEYANGRRYCRVCKRISSRERETAQRALLRTTRDAAGASC